MQQVLRHAGQRALLPQLRRRIWPFLAKRAQQAQRRGHCCLLALAAPWPRPRPPPGCPQLLQQRLAQEVQLLPCGVAAALHAINQSIQQLQNLQGDRRGREGRREGRGISVQGRGKPLSRQAQKKGQAA